MKYLIITETDWQNLRDEVLSLAACSLKAFGEQPLAAQRGHLSPARHQQAHPATLPRHKRDTLYADREQVLLQAGGRRATALRKI